MEQKHSMVNLWLCGKRKQHPVTVSLANRVLEFERRVRAAPGHLQEVGDAFDQMRTAKQACERLGLMGHPCVQDVIAKGRGTPHASRI